MSEIKMNITVDTSEITEALEKAERLGELIREANSLSDELASKEINISVSTNN